MQKAQVIAKTRLSCSGLSAEILADPDSETGSEYILRIGGADQSHVNLWEPWEIKYEYLRRIANACDSIFSQLLDSPLKALHLGAGALTLARYLHVTQPGSEHLAVDIEPEIFEFVAENLPLPDGIRLTTRVGDAKAELYAEITAGNRFDLLVADIFSGKTTAPHLATAEFYSLALQSLSGQGVLLVNVGDDPGQRFLAGQARELAAAVKHQTWHPELAEPIILTDTRVAKQRDAGNAILVAGPGIGLATNPELVEEFKAQMQQAGPHPAAVGNWQEIIGA